MSMLPIIILFIVASKPAEAPKGRKRIIITTNYWIQNESYPVSILFFWEFIFLKIIAHFGDSLPSYCTWSLILQTKWIKCWLGEWLWLYLFMWWQHRDINKSGESGLFVLEALQGFSIPRCKDERQYILTLQVSIVCLLALQSGAQ